MKPRAPVYLAFELDALPKSDLAARSVGLDDGFAARALLSVWEYAWREQVEWIRPEVLLGCCRGNARLAEALASEGFGFLEPVPAGWTSEPCTPEPIPVAGHRIRGARRYLRIGSPQSLGGHAAKSNLVPGGPRRRQPAEPEGGATGAETSADARQALGRLSADTSAGPGHQRAASSEQRESQRQHLAGADAPAGRPPGGVDLQLNGESGPKVSQPAVTSRQSRSAVEALQGGRPSAPSQTPTPPAKDAQEPAQAAWRGDFRLVEQGAGKRERKPSAAQEFATWVAERSGRQETLARGTWVHVAEGLKRYGAERMRAAYVAFLADAWARSLDPPCPMRAFAAPSKLEEYVSAGDRRGSAGGPPDCEVCGRPCQHKEYGRDLCEGCRSAFLGERVAAGWEWTPKVTEESERAAVAEWIERQSEARHEERRA